MKTRIRKSESGLSLTELTVVIGVFSILSGMVYATFAYQSETFRVESAQSATQSGLRHWLLRMVKDMRRCGDDPRESDLFGVIEIGDTQFRCTTDADADGVVDDSADESIGYKFENGTLYSWQRGTTWRPLLTGVGGLRFTYRDIDGDVTAVALSVSTIEVALAVEASSASYVGQTSSTAPVPTISVGSTQTTVTLPSGLGAGPLLAQVEQATLRNVK